MVWREFMELDGFIRIAGMFPVDNRLEDAMEWGGINLRRTGE